MTKKIFCRTDFSASLQPDDDFMWSSKTVTVYKKKFHLHAQYIKEIFHLYHPFQEICSKTTILIEAGRWRLCVFEAFPSTTIVSRKLAEDRPDQTSDLQVCCKCELRVDNSCPELTVQRTAFQTISRRRPDFFDAKGQKLQKCTVGHICSWRKVKKTKKTKNQDS